MTEGLAYPADLAAWQKWDRGQRGFKAQVRHQWSKLPWHGRLPIMVTSTSGAGCDLLVTLEDTTPAEVFTLLRPLERLSGLSIKIASPEPITEVVPGGHWREGHADIDAVTILATRAQVVLSLGHELPLGAAAFRGLAATVPAKRAAFVTAQYREVERFSAPLAPDSHLAAWSAAQADFWVSGRSDVAVTVVGSQLEWEAVNGSAERPAADSGAGTDAATDEPAAAIARLITGLL